MELLNRRYVMLTVKGVYKDGKVIIKEEIKTDKPLNVMVTFWKR